MGDGIWETGNGKRDMGMGNGKSRMANEELEMGSKE